MLKFNIPYHSKNQYKYFNQLIENKHYANGGLFSSKIKVFFKEKYNFQNTYLTTSCTSAIQLCAMAIDFNEDDEIIIPSYTFPSTPTPFLMQSCKIVFADCNPDYPNVGLAEIEKLTTPKTKAVMIVHYGGYHNEIDKIADYCKKHNIVLIEDAAQSINTFHNNKPLGSFGDFGVFSFHETKNINCGEGGLLVVNNEKYLPQLETLSQFGTNRTDFLEGKVDNYEWVSLGLSFGLSEINCAFLYPQLLEIEEVTQHRKQLWNEYYSSLKNSINLPPFEVKNGNAHTFCIYLDNENIKTDLQAHLSNKGIQSVSHYYPLHLSKYGASITKNKSLPNSESFGNCLLRLPLHNDLKIEEVKLIAKTIIDFFETH
jgi:dTDP-4-amino-4,6-dideoxygalactose transaminase